MTQTYIGTIAGQANVPVKTIRYYEDIGLLPKPARTGSGYRVYSAGVVARLEFIKKAQSLGLRLKNIKEILELADRGRCPCGHVQDVLNNRLEELRRKIANLRLVERRIAAAVHRGCPPNFRPSGRAICPTIERQPLGTRCANCRKEVKDNVTDTQNRGL